MGHTILAMGGKEHHDHRSLVAKAFRATALERWEPSVIGPVCDQLVDEIKNDGHADLVKALTFEFPTRIISDAARTPPRGSRPVPAAVTRPDLDPDRHHGGVDRGGRVARLLPRPGRAAAPQADQRHHRRPGRRRDRRREAHRRGHHRVPAAAAARRTGDHLPLVGQPAVPAADPPRAAGDGLPGPVADTRSRSKRACGSKPR